MDVPSPQQLLTAVLSEIPALNPQELTMEVRFRTLNGWDSLAGLMLLSLLETTFQVEVTPLELRNCQTMQDVHALLVRKLYTRNDQSSSG